MSETEPSASRFARIRIQSRNPAALGSSTRVWLDDVEISSYLTEVGCIFPVGGVIRIHLTMLVSELEIESNALPDIVLNTVKPARFARYRKWLRDGWLLLRLPTSLAVRLGLARADVVDVTTFADYAQRFEPGRLVEYRGK